MGLRSEDILLCDRQQNLDQVSQKQHDFSPDKNYQSLSIVNDIKKGLRESKVQTTAGL